MPVVVRVLAMYEAWEKDGVGGSGHVLVIRLHDGAVPRAQGQLCCQHCGSD